MEEEEEKEVRRCIPQWSLDRQTFIKVRSQPTIYITTRAADKVVTVYTKRSMCREELCKSKLDSHFQNTLEERHQ